MQRIAVVLALALAAVACSKKGPKEGTERGPCYGNKTCNDGLICLSDLCVRPPPADCEKVVEKLGFLTLDNWAPRKQREELRAQLLPACQKANLSEKDGDCILQAKHKRDLKKCKKPLVLGDCKRMIAHLRSIAAKDPKLSEELSKESDATLLRECEKTMATKVDEACVLGAASMQDLKSCRVGK